MRSTIPYLLVALALGLCPGQTPSPGQSAGAPAPQPEMRGIPRTLIDRRLQERAVQLIGIDAQTISYVDGADLVRTEPREEFLAILPQASADGSAVTPGRPAVVLELVDGERLAGALVQPAPGSAAPADSISWENPLLGSAGGAEIKLDLVRLLRLSAPLPGVDMQPGPGKADTDLVLLANGDRIEGLVEGLVEGPAVRIGVNSQSRDIKLELVQEIRLLSNPAARVPPGAVMAWLRDGSVIACRALHTNRAGQVSLELAFKDQPAPKSDDSTLASAGSLGLADIVALDLHPGSLVPLASLTPADQKPTGTRRWTRPADALGENALLNLQDLEVPGPMTIEWELPAGATRLAAGVELPRAMWNWGDAEMVVSLVSAGRETELFRQHLSAEQPKGTINASLEHAASGSRLRVRLESGAYGPIQNKVLLRRPVVLVGQNP